MGQEILRYIPPVKAINNPPCQTTWPIAIHQLMNQSHQTLTHKGHHQVCHCNLVDPLGLQLKLPINCCLVNHCTVTYRHVHICCPLHSTLEVMYTCKGLESQQPNLDLLWFTIEGW